MATKARHKKTAIQLWVMDNRKRLDLTSQDLADLTGVTEDTARGWESRGRPSDDALQILARRFGVPLPDQDTPSGDIPALVSALTAALQEQAHALADIRLELREARHAGEEQRVEIARILGDLDRRLAAALSPANRPNGSAVPGSGHAE